MINDELDNKIENDFPYYICSKKICSDLKNQYNIPSFVLEFLIGAYCYSDDVMEEGLNKIHSILDCTNGSNANLNYIIYTIQQKGTYRIIDKIKVVEFIDGQSFSAILQSIGIRIVLNKDIIDNYNRLLTEGLWAVIDLTSIDLTSMVPNKNKAFKRCIDAHIKVSKITPIQMSSLIDFDEIIELRNNYTKDEWISLLIRSIGFNDEELTDRQKMHVLERLIPICTKNYNMVEFGGKSTGKTYAYKEISPFSSVISGSQASIASLFFDYRYNIQGSLMQKDCVCFDEIANVNALSDVIQSLKDYMSSGSFNRGRGDLRGFSSVVMVGNISENPQQILETNNLFCPFHKSISNDTAFFDRIHYYLPGWEMPKLHQKLFTTHKGFIVDYFAEYLKYIRNYNYKRSYKEFFTLNDNVNKRDEIAIEKTIYSFLKLLYPDENYSKDDLKEIIEYAIEGRRRVKEQLYLIDGAEFKKYELGYIDNDTNEEIIVKTPESISKRNMKGLSIPGTVFSICKSSTGSYGLYKCECRVTLGEFFYVCDRRYIKSIETFKAAFSLLGDSALNPYYSPELRAYTYFCSIYDLQDTGYVSTISLAALLAMISAYRRKSLRPSMIIAGNVTNTGNFIENPSIEECMRIAASCNVDYLLIHKDTMKNVESYDDYLQELSKNITILEYENLYDAIKLAFND